jgi:hypothetical protein
MVQNGGIRGDLPKELEWDFNIPSCDRFMVQSLLKMLGITALVFAPVIFLGAFLLIYIAYMLVIALVIVLSAELIVLFIIPRSYRQVRFRVEKRGAGFTTRSEQWPVFKAVGFFLTLMGIVQERLVSVVIGLQASQTHGAGIGNAIRWHDVRQVLLYPKERVVTLRERWFTGGLGGGLRSLRLYCTPENYETVAAMSLEYSKKKEPNANK